MNNDAIERGKAELRAVRRKSRGLYWAVGLFSLFANLLIGGVFVRHHGHYGLHARADHGAGRRAVSV